MRSILGDTCKAQRPVKNTLVKGRTLTGEPRAWVFTSKKHGEAYLYVFSRIVQVCSIDRHNYSTTGTPAISTTTTVEIRKSSVMTTEITSKVEKSPTTASGNSSCPSTETEEEKAKRLLYCSLCKVAVNSASQLEAHNSGTKHKTMLEARNGSGAIKAFPRAGVKGKGPVNKGNTGLQNKTFHCEICDVHVNSETQLKQHISSRRHKDRAAGKPPKPKYSPYNKLQKAAHPLGVKLVFSKEPSKPLAPRLLPGPLAAAAAAVAVGSPFGLRAAPPALLPALPPALLRPAPGPMRSAHAPVLFAPY
ncbi:hypothetical protein JEQ12_013319 [Ovis aries]|uniref:C2H2-type domain-containing protein n=1 Tax=Ovis aries TaxID=9940 RepID=A0A835ZH95_SHEEP|nr:hypothetical protein JEQ12_013319 [Ovis aries]